MANTHLPHPEDTILTGDLRAFRDLYGPGHVSLKIDGGDVGDNRFCLQAGEAGTAVGQWLLIFL